MKFNARKAAGFVLRWGIAIGGIWWVIANMSIADHVLVLDAGNRPVQARMVAELPGGKYRIIDPVKNAETEVDSSQLLSRPDRKKVSLAQEGKPRTMWLLAMDLNTEGQQRLPTVRRLLVADTQDGAGRWIMPAEVVNGFQLRVPHPKVELGLETMVVKANPWMLVLSVAIFIVTIIITSVRWQWLLKALEIPLSVWRTTVLNMVGLFYNTFIPMGSMGGDLLKAYYAAAHTQYKMRAVMSVVVDRVIGLTALIILGGFTAGFYWLMAENKQEPSAHACGYVALMAFLIMAGMGAFLLVAFTPRLRTLIGFERLLGKLPMQHHIQGAVEVMTICRKRPWLMFWSVVVTFPVHITVIISALLAGEAFGLPLTWGYYFIVVPVSVLVAAIPISPQGAGVMEYFTIMLTARQGATISQAFALTMSIRVVQMLWNLLGGVFVVSGHYRAPQGAEHQKEPSPVG